MTRPDIPQEFKDYARRLLGAERYARFAQALDEDPSVSVRLNPFKAVWSGLLAEDLNGVDGSVPWASGEGCYLSERPPFTFDPLFHAGAYYVQEAASMFLGQILRRYVTRPVVALDLCAAPGGKSTHIRSCLPEGSLLVSNEPVKARAQVLLENLTKWGHPDVVVTNSYPKDFARLPDFFDLLVTDVPCSGEGMFRKDPVAVEEWSTDNVQVCWQRQRRILADIWPALKPGGLLIYSTCTYNREEDEENVAWIADELGAEILKVPVASEWGIIGNLAGQDFPVYRFLPHRVKGEGFFLAVLRKSAAISHVVPCIRCQDDKEKITKKKRKGEKGSLSQVVPFPKEVKSWLKQAEDFRFEVRGTKVIAFPNVHLSEYDLFRQKLKVVHAGVTIGELKGKDVIPDHSLAMSTLLNHDGFSRFELTYEQAIAYLRKEAITLDASVPRGYILLTYKNIPLGFAKNIGNRANNLYPQEWRIRSGYLPEELSFVC